MTPVRRGSVESVYNPHTSSHCLAGVELTKLPLDALTSNQSNCNARRTLVDQAGYAASRGFVGIIAISHGSYFGT
jgi:hypothetical protein